MFISYSLITILLLQHSLPGKALFFKCWLLKNKTKQKKKNTCQKLKKKKHPPLEARHRITLGPILRLLTVVSELLSVDNKPQRRYLSVLLGSVEHDGNTVKVSILWCIWTLSKLPFWHFSFKFNYLVSCLKPYSLLPSSDSCNEWWPKFACK